MAEISIIVPVYNKEKYLRDTLNALCAQTFDDLEIILVDDGSTDDSGKICDEYSKKDVRVRTVHTENRGVSAARNTALELAKGKYIGFFDSDDIPYADMYEALLKLLRKTDADIAITAPLVVYDDGNERSPAKNGGEFIFEGKDEIMGAFLASKFGASACRALIKSELAKAVKFDEAIKINEDKLYIFEIMKSVGRVCYLDEAKFKYFRRNNSSSLTRFSAKFFDCLTVAEKIDEEVKAEYPALTDISKAALAKTRLWLLKIMYLENGCREYKAQWNESAAFLRGLDGGFCKKHLDRNDYIKWLSLKLGSPVFKLVTSLFSEN